MNFNMNIDYYNVLGLKKEASKEEIKKTYRKMSLKHHPDRKGGSEEAFKKINDRKIKYIINLQGDEPLIDINDIRNLNKIVQKNKFGISTLASKIKNKKIFNNKNIVKVKTKKKLTFNKPQKALNFYRYQKKRKKNFYQHIGIYQYSVSTLEKFSNLKRSKNEIKNKLEQMRALDNKISINVILAKKNVVGIDTKEDYMELKNILEYKN